ncbi:MAG: hypothetical protein JRI95_15890 [Deltaproteobacteria bacterium]|nr:hypothetical protein [Deltaproteobacteria bacterium]
MTPTLRKLKAIDETRSGEESPGLVRPYEIYTNPGTFPALISRGLSSRYDTAFQMSYH